MLNFKLIDCLFAYLLKIWLRYVLNMPLICLIDLITFLTAWAIQRPQKSKIDRLTDSQINKEHISFYDSAWLFMTLLEFVWHVWLCMTVDDFVWLCKTMYDYIWLCMTIYDNVWICMIMHDCVWLCKYMQNYVWLWKTLYDSV